MLEADDGRAQQLDAVLAQLARPAPAVSELRNFAYDELGDSRPSQIHETPSCTSSSMVYLRMALADENTYSDQLLPACFMRSSNCMARGRLSRKFSSIMKNEQTFMECSMCSITSNSSSPDLVEVDALAFAAEERGGGAEVASHGTSDRRNDGGGGVARVVGNAHAQHAHAEAGKNFRMQ